MHRTSSLLLPLLLTLSCADRSAVENAPRAAPGSGGAAGATGGGASGSSAGGSSNGAFVHPGTLDGKAELDYVKARLAQRAEPYLGQLDRMKDVEQLELPPSPQTSVDANSASADAARDDARRAYGNALVWYLTDDVAYAERAVAYLNAWSELQAITAKDGQNRLVAGWLGSLFGPAADLMRGYSGWSVGDVEKMRAMFERAFYPLLNTASTWNGNVDLHQISAMMAIAVFNEDRAELDLGLTRLSARIPAYFYLASDGEPPRIAGDNGNVAAFWGNPAKWVDGLTQESCRDNGHHAQFGLSGALGAMETAWHQGIDVYSSYQPRMIASLELMGLQGSSGSMQGTCANDATSADVYDTWEIGYNHFHVRKGIALPRTWTMISSKVRAAQSNPGAWSIFYETLTHADITYP
ncbi:MAG: alginate lyase family protein [Myxococcales bacterium]